MATQPKPKPKPEPEPDPPEDDDAAKTREPRTLEERVADLSGGEYVTELREILDLLLERMKAPPVGIGRRP